MSIYLNAVIMLGATLGAILVFAKALQALRSGRGLSSLLRARTGASPQPRRLGIEEVCAVDSRRRLVLVRCDTERMLILTGGPADLVVAVLPRPAAEPAGEPAGEPA